MKFIPGLVALLHVAQVWAAPAQSSSTTAYKLRVSSSYPLDGKDLTLSNFRLGVYPSFVTLGAQPYRFTTSEGTVPGTYTLRTYSPTSTSLDNQLCLVGKVPYLFLQEVSNPAATTFAPGITATWGQYTITPALDQSVPQGKKRLLGYKDAANAKWVAISKGNGAYDVNRFTGGSNKLAKGYFGIDLEVVKA